MMSQDVQQGTCSKRILAKTFSATRELGKQLMMEMTRQRDWECLLYGCFQTMTPMDWEVRWSFVRFYHSRLGCGKVVLCMHLVEQQVEQQPLSLCTTCDRRLAHTASEKHTFSQTH